MTEVPEGAFAAAIAVASHGLLNHVCVLLGATQLLTIRWDNMSSEERLELQELVADQGTHIIEMLRCFMAGTPEGALAILENLRLRKNAA